MTLALVENGVTNLRPMANISSRCAPGTTAAIPWARPNLNHLNLKNTSQTATTYRKVIKRPKIIYAAPHLKRPSSVAARLVRGEAGELDPVAEFMLLYLSAARLPAWIWAAPARVCLSSSPALPRFDAVRLRESCEYR